jgi:predicted nuclease of predicted toxin-antitoxin system
MKLLFDESLSPKLVLILRDLFPDSESALRNGLARAGDRRILAYAAAHGFILVSTDSDFERLLRQIPGAKVVILRSCDYPTDIAADVLRRNAIVSPSCPTLRINCRNGIRLPGASTLSRSAAELKSNLRTEKDSTGAG